MFVCVFEFLCITEQGENKKKQVLRVFHIIRRLSPHTTSNMNIKMRILYCIRLAYLYFIRTNALCSDRVINFNPKLLSKNTQHSSHKWNYKTILHLICFLNSFFFLVLMTMGSFNEIFISPQVTLRKISFWVFVK